MKLQRASLGLIAIIVVLVLAILAIDLSLPLGVAAGVPYVVIVLVGWRLEEPRHILLLAGISSALTVVGYFYSPSGGVEWIVLANRMLALFVIWVTAWLLAGLKSADQKARASQVRLAGIVDIAPEAIIAVDEDQRIQLYNRGAEAIFGYAADEVLGRPLEMLLPARFREKHPRNVESFARSHSSRIMLSDRQAIFALRKDGHEFPAEASISKFVHGNKLVFTIMLHDISERKRAEERLHDVMLRAEVANQTKSEFLANMSHELRTPLNAIIGFSEMMKTATLGPIGNPKYADYAKDINDSGQHLLKVINDILDISKIEAGEFELYEEAVDIPGTIGSCLTLVRERADKAGVRLETRIAAGIPPLQADERKLKQILINLLSNAVKFTPEGGAVRVCAWYSVNDGVVFQVVDTGIGIAQEDIPKVLAKFGQVDGSLSRTYEGTGLGLPLTKSLVELHGGSLDLQSVVGAGTTVTVRFPSSRVVLDASTGT